MPPFAWDNLPTSEVEYTAALQHAVVIPRPQVGRVRALDRDRLDLLHRLSTNDLTTLVAGEARQTVLTTPIARMVDALWVLNRGETALCLTGAGRATAVRRWLAGYIFYNDRVKYEDLSATWNQFVLCGPAATPIAEALAPGAASLAENHFSDNDEVIVWRCPSLVGATYMVLAPNDKVNALWQTAIDTGATPAGEATFQQLRVRAGWPDTAELTEDYIPLEANLWPAVSFSKGCYIGQEIIARMESRGKLARRLCGLRLEAAVPVGAEVRAGDNVVGHITSAVVLLDVGPVALAYLKTAFAEVGTAVVVDGVAGRVGELPFAK